MPSWECLPGLLEAVGLVVVMVLHVFMQTCTPQKLAGACRVRGPGGKQECCTADLHHVARKVCTAGNEVWAHISC